MLPRARATVRERMSHTCEEYKKSSVLKQVRDEKEGGGRDRMLD